MIWTTADTLLTLLLASICGMLVLAVLYLNQRKLSTLSFVLWGLLALSIPLLGPYLVIALRPGEPRQP
jgi:hypothetical protein